MDYIKECNEAMLLLNKIAVETKDKKLKEEIDKFLFNN
jgi:hypothetical protein